MQTIYEKGENMNKEIFTMKDIENFKIKLIDKIKSDGTLDECDKSYIASLILSELIDMNNEKMKELIKC